MLAPETRPRPTGTARRDPRQPPRPHRRSRARRLAREVEGLQVSLAGAEEKLAQLDNLIARRNTTVNVGMPTFPGNVGRHVTAGPQAPTHDPRPHNVGDLGSWRTS